MAYSVIKHSTLLGHYYVDGMLVAGATNEIEAVHIYEEAIVGGDLPPVISGDTPPK